MDMTVVLNPHQFSLPATIEHHGLSMYWGHYSTSVNCCKKDILLQLQQNYRAWNNWYRKTLYCIRSNVRIDYVTGFGLEQEEKSFITPMALAHPLYPITSRLRNKRRDLWFSRCVSFCWPWFWSLNSIYHDIHIMFYRCRLSNENKLLKRYAYQELGWPWRCVGYFNYFLLGTTWFQVYISTV